MGRMIQVVIVAVILSGTVFLSRWDTLQKDVLDHYRINIMSEAGEFKGYMKKGPLFDGRINTYDSKGEQKGWIERDAFHPDSWNFKKR